MNIDDFDVFASIKVWMHHDDMILSSLCTNLVNRNLYKVWVQNEPFLPSFLGTIRNELKMKYKVSGDDQKYFLVEDIVTNSAYSLNDDKIKIIFKDSTLMDVSEASDQLNISVLSSAVSKHVLCYPKNLKI